MEINIRKAIREDLPAVLGLYAELDGERSLDLCDAEPIFDRMKQYPDFAVYVAEHEGEVVGAFELLIMDNLAHKGALSGVVEDVAVASRWRGQGIGKAMMKSAIERCEQAGCYKLTLSSNLIRKSAHEFYKSMGFRQHGYSFLISLEK